MRDLNNLTWEEQILKKVIKRDVDELVGGYENFYNDEPKEFFKQNSDKLTKNDVIETVYYELINDPNPYIFVNWHFAIEKKHIKFLGKKFIKALIEQYVEEDYRKGGWCFPNNYEGA